MVTVYCNGGYFWESDSVVIPLYKSQQHIDHLGKMGKKCRLTVKKNPKMMSQNQNIQNKAQNFLQMVKLNQICIVREVCVCEAFYSDFWQPTPPLFE